MENLLPVYPYYMNSSFRVDSISFLIEVLCMLVHHEPDLSVDREETLLERKAYLNIELYRKFLNDRYTNENITNIFKYASQNYKIGNKIITLVVENLNRFNHDDDYIYLYVHVTKIICRSCMDCSPSTMDCREAGLRDCSECPFSPQSERMMQTSILQTVLQTVSANIGTPALSQETKSSFPSSSCCIRIAPITVISHCLALSAC